jgi:hypothetical protein
MLWTILRAPGWALHQLLRLGLGDRHFQFAREVNQVVAVGRFRYEITYYLYTKYQGLFWDELEFCGLHEITLAFNPGRWSDALFAAMQQSGIKNDEGGSSAAAVSGSRLHCRGRTRSFSVCGTSTTSTCYY